jgi:RNA polymerase-binding transcription factor DksA
MASDKKPNLLVNIKSFLLAKKAKLLANKRKLTKEDPFHDIDRINDNASIDAEAAEEMGHERVEALTAEIDADVSRIGEALTKIDDGEYGKCEDCGKAIEQKRLTLDPTATKCVSCQQKNEVRV